MCFGLSSCSFWQQSLPSHDFLYAEENSHSENVWLYMCKWVCGLGGQFTGSRQKPPNPEETADTGGLLLTKVCILVCVWLCVCVCSLEQNPNQHMKGVYLSADFPAALTGNRCWLQCWVSASSRSGLHFKHAAKFKTEMKHKWWDKRANVMSLLIFSSSDCSLLFQNPPVYMVEGNLKVLYLFLFFMQQSLFHMVSYIFNHLISQLLSFSGKILLCFMCALLGFNTGSPAVWEFRLVLHQNHTKIIIVETKREGEDEPLFYQRERHKRK